MRMSSKAGSLVRTDLQSRGPRNNAESSHLTGVSDGAELYDVNASLLNGHSGLDPDSVDPSTINIQKDKLFEQVVDSGAVLIATVMPCLSWSGMTRDNNTQAVRIAQALKRYTDAGVVTWLRYG